MATASASEPISHLFPNGGWDTHHHIYEPARFPYSPERHLTPPAATLEQFLAFRRRLGLSHSVLTHSLSYGDDCASLRAFLPALNPGSAPRGVGVIDPRAASDAELRALHDAGVRGVRIDLYRRGAMEDAGRQRRAIAEHAARLERLGLGWSLALTTTRAELWAELAPLVAATAARGRGTRLVTDHFALLRAASMLPPPYRDDPARQPGFAAVLGLVRDGHLWVKLSAPYRVSEDGPGYADVEFLVRAFFDANRHRVVWGSDWPHTPRMRLRSREEALEETPFLEVDDLAWLNSLRSWLSDEEWHLLMVENPKALFSC
ncbi:putative amidohydrolase 2 [Rosellinia necatrix]|uniref:Putative amidohydrolase 2 n=1 Tax=Rosellinia necatrix TaxID=77044 RepID=A0A1S7UJC7_ROSNE|nr:putative amidohydrolase 2 [Rosellinia necatrix]